MRISVTTLSDLVITIDVSPDMELENFKALCECEIGIPSHEMIITYEGHALVNNKKTLVEYGIKEGDVVLAVHNRLEQTANRVPDLGIDFSSIMVPGSAPVPNLSPPVTSPLVTPTASSPTNREDDVEKLRMSLMKHPEQLNLLKQNNPRLADAFLSGDKDLFAKVLNAQLDEKSERERKRILMINADPFDPEAQRLIAEEIRQDNVDSNMEAAIEYHPESFGQVTMLYINCKVNGHPVRAFIDSGAQTTIMSQACAERCGIMRLVDKRFAGFAKGVGVQKILGRVHLGHIEINNVFLQSSFSILEDQLMDVLLGLDMLKRHQCCIDLKRNLLVIGTTGTETPFLSESDLPKGFGVLGDLCDIDPTTPGSSNSAIK